MPDAGRASRDRASASIAFEASTPTPWLIRGASSSSTRPVPVPMSSSRPASRSGTSASSAASTAAAGQVERPHLVPVGALAAEAFGGHAGALGQHPGGLAAVGLQDRVVLGQPGDQVARPVRPASPCGRANQTLAPSRTRSSRPQSHSSFRWRDSRGCDWPRISVNSDDAEGAAAGQRQQAQAGRFGGGAQAGEQVFHGLSV